MSDVLDLFLDYMIPVITISIAGILGYIGYRYMRLRKKYNGKIPDVEPDDLWRLKK